MNTLNHAFKDFDASLQGLEDLLLQTLQRIQQLGEACQQALSAMQDKDKVQQILKEARALDKEVNALEDRITALIQSIFSKYNPRGHDMRFVIGSIKIATILESIADKSKNCIKRIFKTETPLSSVTVAHITQMISDTHVITQRIDMLIREYREEIAAEIAPFRRSIEHSYRAIWAGGTLVDADYHNTVMLAKNIERIADMAVDLKKILYFIHTGEKHKKKKKAEAAAE